MIVFDLRCSSGHVFEAWFGSSKDFEQQQGRGLVACPICDDPAVEKAPMAPAVPRKGEPAAALAGGDPAAVKAMLGAMAAVQRKLVAQSDWVGDRFAAEARAIHVGEAKERAIHGRATRADAEELAADGVPIAALPFPVAPPEEQN